MAKKLKQAKPGSIGSRLSGVFRQVYYRRRLKRICKVLEITPYKWQKEYVLADKGMMLYGRCIGKTMAVVLRILVRGPSKGLYPARDLLNDPDIGVDRHRLDITYMEYRECFEKCNAAGLMRKHRLIPRPEGLKDAGILTSRPENFVGRGHHDGYEIDKVFLDERWPLQVLHPQRRGNAHE